MKKIFTLIVSLSLISFAFAQSARTVLIEEATNASCGPCASQNPGFNALLNANLNNVVSIKYQAPFPGYDPMNEHNPVDVDTRMSYYPGITGVPTAMIDGVIPTYGNYPGFGNAYAGAPGAYTQAMIDHATSFTSPFDIDISYVLHPEEITVTVTATCSEAVSGPLRLHIGVIEKEINFSSPPGSTNESDFFGVMKKMLPDGNGTSMLTSYEPGEEFTLTQSWTLANIYDMDEIAVVAFIQDQTTKEVHQAGFDDSGVLEAVYNIDVAAISYENMDVNCESVTNPSFEIRNNGSDTLTSLDIEYDINGTIGTYNWTGSLAFFETATIELGEIEFTSDDDNTLMITLSSPNGDGIDENTANNNLEIPVPVSQETTLGITVKVYTDNYPGETSWKIRNSANLVVASATYGSGSAAGGPNALIMHEHYVLLEDAFDCHSFTIYDSYGDGLAYGPPGQIYGYEVIDGFGETVISLLGGEPTDLNFGSSNENKMTTTDVLSVEKSVLNSSLSLYPNPTSTNLNIAFELERNDHITIDVMNIVGQIVSSQDFGTVSAGYTLKTINVSDLSSGIYLVNITANDGVITRKITVSE